MSGRILIVEPQAEIALLIQTELAARGYDVTHAENGAAGREAIGRGPYDLLLIETVLPFMDGIDLAHEFRLVESAADTPLVLLDSLNANADVTVESVREKCNASAFYRTPLSIGPFIDVLVNLAGDTHRPRSPIILPTPIDGESVPKLIRAFYDLHKTGKLTVRARGVEKSIFFHEGTPLFVASSRLSDHLGTLLRKEGVIDKAGIDKLLRRQRDTGLRFGQLAIQAGYLDETTLYAYLARQLVMVTSDMFELGEGEMYVEDTEPIAEDTLAQPLHPFHLIRAGIELGYSADKLQQRLSPGERYLVPVHTPTFRIQDIRMSELELEFLARVDGTRSIDDLRRTAPLPEAMNMQLIATLIYTRMVWLADKPSAPSDELSAQAERYHAAHDFDDEFFRAPWDQADPGVIHRGDRTYKVIREPADAVKPPEEPLPEFKPDERPKNPDRLLFFVLAILGATIFVLFILSIRPYVESQRMQRILDQQRQEAQIVKPEFLKAMHRYEVGLELMASDDPKDLVDARKAFIEALAIDPRYKEAMAALQQTVAKLEKIEGYRHYVEPPLKIEGVLETPGE